MRLGAVKGMWRVGVVALAAGHTAVACAQQSMNADGLNYLTLGNAFWAGDWSPALNGIWSPLYGVIAGGVLALIDPPIELVFPTVQVVNFLIFLLGLVCFERLWAELWIVASGRSGDGGDGGVPRSGSGPDAEGPSPGLPPWLWWSMGYAFFVWAALDLVEIWSVTPDMLIAAMVYLAGSFMVRIGDGRARPRTYVALGASLGIGYLAKAPLFPLGWVALALTVAAHDRVAVGLRRTLPAILAFVLVSGPLVAAISVREGRVAFSEASRFTYLKHVNRIPFPHWRDGAVEGVGVPEHPPRRVHSDPDVFVYDGPVGGPYPPSTDPDYWTEGLTPRFDVGEQLNEVANGLAFYFSLFFREQGPTVAIVGLLFIAGLASGARASGSWSFLRDGAWHLTVWAVACFGMYALVFVSERYVAPFVLLFWAGLLSYWRPVTGRLPARLSRAAGTLVAVFTVVNVLALNVEGVAAMMNVRPPIEMEARGQFSMANGAGGSPPVVAAGLREAGLAAGEDIAYIGYSYTALWTYLVDARIVAEIWPEQASAFWQADAAERDEVLGEFRDAGASWVVAAATPVAGPPDEAGWRRAGRTGYWILPLNRGREGR